MLCTTTIFSEVNTEMGPQGRARNIFLKNSQQATRSMTHRYLFKYTKQLVFVTNIIILNQTKIMCIIKRNEEKVKIKRI
jgi:hypothetical protein